MTTFSSEISAPAIIEQEPNQTETPSGRWETASAVLGTLEEAQAALNAVTITTSDGTSLEYSINPKVFQMLDQETPATKGNIHFTSRGQENPIVLTESGNNPATRGELLEATIQFISTGTSEEKQSSRTTASTQDKRKFTELDDENFRSYLEDQRQITMARFLREHKNAIADSQVNLSDALWLVQAHLNPTAEISDEEMARLREISQGVDLEDELDTEIQTLQEKEQNDIKTWNDEQPTIIDIPLTEDKRKETERNLQQIRDLPNWHTLLNELSEITVTSTEAENQITITQKDLQNITKLATKINRDLQRENGWSAKADLQEANIQAITDALALELLSIHEEENSLENKRRQYLTENFVPNALGLEPEDHVELWDEDEEGNLIFKITPEPKEDLPRSPVLITVQRKDFTTIDSDGRIDVVRTIENQKAIQEIADSLTPPVKMLWKRYLGYLPEEDTVVYSFRFSQDSVNPVPPAETTYNFRRNEYTPIPHTKIDPTIALIRTIQASTLAIELRTSNNFSAFETPIVYQHSLDGTFAISIDPGDPEFDTLETHETFWDDEAYTQFNEGLLAIGKNFSLAVNAIENGIGQRYDETDTQLFQQTKQAIVKLRNNILPQLTELPRDLEEAFSKLLEILPQIQEIQSNLQEDFNESWYSTERSIKSHLELTLPGIDKEHLELTLIPDSRRIFPHAEARYRVTVTETELDDEQPKSFEITVTMKPDTEAPDLTLTSMTIQDITSRACSIDPGRTSAIRKLHVRTFPAYDRDPTKDLEIEIHDQDSSLEGFVSIDAENSDLPPALKAEANLKLLYWFYQASKQSLASGGNRAQILSPNLIPQVFVNPQTGETKFVAGIRARETTPEQRQRNSAEFFDSILEKLTNRIRESNITEQMDNPPLKDFLDKVKDSAEKANGERIPFNLILSTINTFSDENFRKILSEVRKAANV
ncbi:hypothetical protein GF357_04775 [Candidatus Dojkabacteria bacterium]|nr:hypothetical protein [Candidatus Dojkabacteria bacterium]